MYKREKNDDDGKGIKANAMHIIKILPSNKTTKKETSQRFYVIHF